MAKRKRRHKTVEPEEVLDRMEPCKWASLPSNFFDPFEVEARASCRTLIDGALDAEDYLSFESLFGQK